MAISKLGRRGLLNVLHKVAALAFLGVRSVPTFATTSKYRLDQAQTITVAGVLLYRVIRLADSELGGFVQSEENLSQNGTCFAYKDSRVYGNSRVMEDAQVYGEVFEDAVISGKATVIGKAYGHAQVMGRAKIVGEAFGNSTVRDQATVIGRIFGNAVAQGNELVIGDRSS